MLEIGSVVDGKYKVLNKIGQGGMSVVYLVMNERANKQWAIKEVRKDGVKDFEVVKQGLVVETDLLKRLNHPNLPSIIDVIDQEDNFLIVMDYIQGNHLGKTIEEYGAQPQELVIDWAKQLCDVLGYLHSRTPAIIYRDMKPSNVMLKPDGTLTLIDFGTAREFKERNLADTTCLGTIGYAAPEQFGGQGQTDGRTDIYCLGATLYHLVTGMNPSEPPYEMRPIREINPRLSSGLEKIIIKCTQRNPEDRYQSCAELMYALEHFEEIDDLYRKKQKKKVHRFVASCVATVVFAIAGITTTVLANQMATDNYNELIGQAQKAASAEKKESIYQEAIAVKQSSGNAYLGLIDTYKEDSIYTTVEEEKLVSYLKNNKDAIVNANGKEYAEICFQTGKLYWYYYENDNTNENRTSRMKAAISWFSDALFYGGDTFTNIGMATIYKEIGTFYRDVPSKAMEGADKGMYRPFFDKLNQLIALVEENDSESEIVKLELYELARYSIMQYASKFKADEVTKEELVATYGKVATNLNAVATTTEKTSEMKESSKSLLSDTRKAIDTAFDS